MRSSNPIAIALFHVAESRRLLDSLLTSSETFNYPKAKVALRQLRAKQRELAALQAELERQSPGIPSNVCPVDFSVNGSSRTGM